MMYCFKFPNDIDTLLDGRPINYAGKEIGIGREKMSKILHAKELCKRSLANKIVSRFKPNEKVDKYFDKYTESEARSFYAKRNIRINKRRID